MEKIDSNRKFEVKNQVGQVCTVIFKIIKIINKINTVNEGINILLFHENNYFTSLLTLLGNLIKLDKKLVKTEHDRMVDLKWRESSSV